MDFRYAGSRCREYTALTDTPANRKRLEKALAKIESEIAGGTFDYAKTFPGSKVPGVAAASAGSPVPGANDPVANVAVSPTPPFAKFAETWFEEHKVEWRRSHIKVLRSTLDGHERPR
jgi:integrase